MNNSSSKYNSQTYIGYFKMKKGGMKIIPGEIDTNIINKRNKILSHLDIVLSGGKKLKERNIENYFKALGGKYTRNEICGSGSNACKKGKKICLGGAHELLKLAAKNNLSMENILNKFKGSAPTLYEKLEYKITGGKGGVPNDNMSETPSYSSSGGIDQDKIDNNMSETRSYSRRGGVDPDEIDDDDTLATNLSGMSDIPPLKGYSEDKLPEYAILRLKTINIDELRLDTVGELTHGLISFDDLLHTGPVLYDNANIYIAKEFIKINGLNPNNWDIQNVLLWLANSYKKTEGADMMYSLINIEINHELYGIHDIGKYPWKTTDSVMRVGRSDEPDKVLSTLFGRDKLLIGLYDILLYPTDFSKNMIQFLLYWFYFVEPSSESILARTGWTKVDKTNDNAIIYNPTAGLLMRLIEVLHYINVRYLYPQCVAELKDCSKVNTSICTSMHLKIKRMNESFLNKLTKVSQPLLLKIQKKMSKGQYSTVFREFFEFKNFNDPTGEKYKNKKTFEFQSCENILKNYLYTRPSITHTWSLGGEIKHNDNMSETRSGGIDPDKIADYMSEVSSISSRSNSYSRRGGDRHQIRNELERLRDIRSKRNSDTCQILDLKEANKLGWVGINMADEIVGVFCPDVKEHYNLITKQTLDQREPTPYEISHPEQGIIGSRRGGIDYSRYDYRYDMYGGQDIELNKFRGEIGRLSFDNELNNLRLEIKQIRNN